MAKQLTAPGCKYSIVARVDTTIYSPDQKWVLDVPAGQTDFIAETNEIIIPADAMMCRKKCQIDADLARVNILGTGSGSLATFVTRAIEQIVGKGNAKVKYGDGKVTVALALDTTAAQITAVETLLERMLPKDVTEEVVWTDGFPVNYTRLEYLRNTGTQYLALPVEYGQTSGFAASYEVAPYASYAYLSLIRYRGKSIQFGRIYSDGNTGITVTSPTVSTVVFNKGKIFVAYNEFESGKIKVASPYAEKETDIPHTPAVGESITPVYLFAYDTAANLGVYNPSPASYSLYEARFTRGQELVSSYVPALDPTGTPCMFDMVTRQTFRNNGTGQFIAGFDTTEKAAISLSKLPVTTDGTLTVSLPAAAKDEASWVPEACRIAAQRGWTIFPQYRED